MLFLCKVQHTNEILTQDCIPNSESAMLTSLFLLILQILYFQAVGVLRMQQYTHVHLVHITPNPSKICLHTVVAQLNVAFPKNVFKFDAELYCITSLPDQYYAVLPLTTIFTAYREAIVSFVEVM